MNRMTIYVGRLFTNFAGFNHIKAEKSWICYPAAGHNVWEQKGWPEARQQFLDSFLSEKI